MKRKTSLKDIAREVGVSIPLVSYVLSNKDKENRVSKETAKRIRKVALELNYTPNLNARSLKTNRTQTIGVILADISNSFFSNLARIIEDEAFAKEYTVIFGSSDENIVKFEKVLNFLLTRQVDGLIIAPPEGSRDLITVLKKSGIPFVLIDRYFKGLDINYIVLDNYNASYNATQFLLSKGNRKIALIRWKSDMIHYKDRQEGFSKALSEFDREKTQGLIKEISAESFESEIKNYIEYLIEIEKADAIFFQTNTLASEGIKHMINMDREILKKVDVVAFDKNSAYSFLETPIPYISQPIKKMGQKALRTLICMIEEKETIVIKDSFKASLKNKKLKNIVQSHLKR